MKLIAHKLQKLQELIHTTLLNQIFGLRKMFIKDFDQHNQH